MVSKSQQAPAVLDTDKEHSTLKMPHQHWWRHLAHDFPEHKAHFKLSLTQKLKMTASTSTDLVLRGGIIAATSLLSFPMSIRPDIIMRDRKERQFYWDLVTTIRGSEFQSLSKRGRFTSSSNVSAGNAIAAGDGLANTWGLGLPFYNLNANIALYSSSYTGAVYSLDGSNNVTSGTVTNTQRLGLALALSTEGKNSDGSKTTSILVIDGGANANNAGKPTDYYLGLRNLDMLLRGYGSVGFENGNLNINLPDLLMVMSAEIAGGYLPGAKYKTRQRITLT